MKFRMEETIHSYPVLSARLGTTGSPLNDKDVGKPVKIIAESNYGLCADGDEIEGFMSSAELAKLDGFAVGGVQSPQGYKYVTASGTLGIGDYVVSAANPAANTALTAKALVKKAADQAVAKAGLFKWRVVSLGAAGTGASGTQCLIERV